ncbi:MAG: acetyl-CoA carboxylase carboxyltransferase subunit beta [Calditrichaeota bacterium]|nr:acetyl-CoA carboxylase carboxyltransferase subunit beta [Calditrichota bacterium]
MPDWFKRTTDGLKPKTRKNIPDGVWIKCDSCGESLFKKELDRNVYVCPKCGNHFRISSNEYIELLLDKGSPVEHDAGLKSTDILKFKDSIKYSDRIVKYTKKSGLTDAIRCFSGSMDEIAVELAVMDFKFMGGSVGSVVGEKFCRAVSRAVDAHCPMIAISCSGGMRMQEGIFSLMQMAKSSAILTKLSAVKQPYISILTNPTTGGTTASFAMLGDINIAEPGALIGFAGPRVIKQTIGQDLPEGFQSSDFVLEHGFMDMIVERKELKTRIVTLLGMLGGK